MSVGMSQMADSAEPERGQPYAGRRWRRVRTPTVIQMEAAECGAAALAIVLASYGRYVPLEELRIVCGISRDGSRASSIVRAAQHYGLEAKGHRLRLESMRTVRYPAIVFWNFNHFVVLEGFRGDTVYLNDPKSGPRKVSLREFDESFTGVALTFGLGPGFRPGGRPLGVLANLRRRLYGEGTAVGLIMLFSLLLVVPGIVVPGISKVFIDEILVRGTADLARPLLVGLAATMAVQGFLVWMQQRCLLRLETKLAMAGSARLIWHVLHLPVSFFMQRHSGDLANRVAANNQIAALLSGDLSTSAINAVTIVFYAAVMASYDPTLTAIGVGFASANLLAFAVARRKRRDLNLQLQTERAAGRSTITAGIRAIETLKSIGGEDQLFGRWAGQQARSINTRQRIALWNIALGVLPPFLAGLNTAAILGIGGLKVIDGAMSVGTLVAFQALMIGFSAPIQSLMGVGGRIAEVQSNLERIDDVLRYPADKPAMPAPQPDAAASSKLSGRVELAGVTFGYNPLDAPLIEGFDLVLEPGSRVALVGPSGSGKSTIVQLVTGLLQPQAGEVRFDGVAVSDVPRARFANSVASVSQEIFLFEGSIRDNLTMWRRDIVDEDLIQAAKDAAIHDAIAERPRGYEAGLTEGGTNLSGGERQRLELARALARNPTVLVLDEATSALDPVVEAEIDARLRRRGCTCLIAAHRLSTIRDCDEIVVLDQGKVVDRGTHDELMRSSDAYRRLIET